MPALTNHINQNTPMGATLIGNGATFRVWAPAAFKVHLLSDLSGWVKSEANELVRGSNGDWLGFWPDFSDGGEYKFWVEGEGSSGFKRDPRARELSWNPSWPDSNCVVRDPLKYPWRVRNFQAPPFHKAIIYQLHIGAFYSPLGGAQRGSMFDVIAKIPYLKDLGVTVVQLLPIQEFYSEYSLGYNGVDYFSPENDYAVRNSQIDAVLPIVNELLRQQNLDPLLPSHLEGPANQLRCLVDLFHGFGIAVIFDVVYNHAGGDFGDQSMYFFDRQPAGDNNRSLYFTSQPESGGLCFALWKQEVRQFLIDNAKFFFEEYHIDGLRHDHVRIILNANVDWGWKFCQDLNSTCKFNWPSGLQNAELWPVEMNALRPAWEGGAAFDTSLTSGLRDRLREAVEQSSNGKSVSVNLSAVRNELWAQGFFQSWKAIQNLETHDEVYRDRRPRIPTLADKNDHRSWYARSRARLANGLLLTAPGIPMLFMGQEFLEDKQWADDVKNHSGLRIHWAGLDGSDPSMRDHLRFTRELIWLRRNLPGMTGEGFRPFHADDHMRVLAFHRWVPDQGHDIIVVASLAEINIEGYRIGFPYPGTWKEVFNSDVYDGWVNPGRRGNGGVIDAERLAWHDFNYSASIVIPPNSVLIFAR